jgi:hypothetical protein
VFQYSLRFGADLAARIVDVPIIDILNDPAFLMRTCIDAAREINLDGGRLNLFPFKKVEKSGDEYFIVTGNGARIGTVDISSILYDAAAFDLSNEEIISTCTPKKLLTGGRITQIKPFVNVGPADTCAKTYLSGVAKSGQMKSALTVMNPFSCQAFRFFMAVLFFRFYCIISILTAQEFQLSYDSLFFHKTKKNRSYTVGIVFCV